MRRSSVVRSSAAMKLLIFVTGFGYLFACAAAQRQTGAQSGASTAPSSILQRIETSRGTCQCVPFHACDIANTVDTTISKVNSRSRGRRQTQLEKCSDMNVCCLSPKVSDETPCICRPKLQCGDNDTLVITAGKGILQERMGLSCGNDVTCCHKSFKLPGEIPPIENPDKVPCLCRSFFQCGNNDTDVIEGGATLIIEKFGDASPPLNCVGEQVVCCHKSFRPVETTSTSTENPDSSGGTTAPPFTIPRTCGTRNEKIGFSMNRVQTAGDGQTWFGEYPWTLAVFAVDSAGNYEFLCGASLVQQGVAITAAHCIRKFVASDLIVRAGEWDVRDDNPEETLSHQEQLVSEMIIHPDFHNATLYNDIAILRLVAPFTPADNIGLICLPSKDSPDPSHCIATGWGKKAFKKDAQLQAVMKQVSLPYVFPSECQRKLRKTRLGEYFILDKSFNCAGGVSDEDTCVGDGGGPLSCIVAGSEQFYLIGITAWGIECGTKDVPGVYTNVRLFFDWISSHLQ